jgi:hypothetical protein
VLGGASGSLASFETEAGSVAHRELRMRAGGGMSFPVGAFTLSAGIEAIFGYAFQSLDRRDMGEIDRVFGDAYPGHLDALFGGGGATASASLAIDERWSLFLETNAGMLFVPGSDELATRALARASAGVTTSF